MCSRVKISSNLGGEGFPRRSNCRLWWNDLQFKITPCAFAFSVYTRNSNTGVTYITGLSQGVKVDLAMSADLLLGGHGSPPHWEGGVKEPP